MAYKDFGIADFNQASYFKSWARNNWGSLTRGYTTPSSNTQTKGVTVSGIPAGATITAYNVYFNVDTGLYGGTHTPASGASVDPSNISFYWNSRTGGSYPSYPTSNTGDSTNYQDKTGLCKRTGIYVRVTYTIGGGSTPPPVGGGGPVVITPSAIDAGAGSVTVTCPAEAGIWHMIDWTFGTQSGQWSHPWEAGGTRTISIPLSWIAEMPSATQGTLAIRVRRSTTPSMPYSYATDQTTNVTIKVPASVVPSISDFTATLVPNGVPGTIAGYVQNKSKVALAMTAAGGSYSPIASYSITGGGISGNSATGTFGPFNLSGDVVFTAKVTDARGRTATRQAAIEIMPYTAPAFSSPEAWRSNFDGVKNQKGTYVRLKSGASFSSLGEQNTVSLKGRVYIKGGTAPAWSSMTPGQALILGGGALLFTGTYIAQMEVADLIGSRVIEFTIPTKKTGVSIMAGMQGIAFGKSAEIPGYAEFGWPIYNCPYEIGDILQTLNTSSPEDRWPGTEWEAITGRVLVGLDSTQTEFDTAGEEGGSKTVQLGLDSGYAKIGVLTANYVHLKTKAVPTGDAYETNINGTTYSPADNAGGRGTELGGTTDSGSNLQPYKVVYMWLRTA